MIEGMNMIYVLKKNRMINYNGFIKIYQYSGIYY